MISPGRISGDLAGSVFGGWTVIKFLPRPKDGGGSSWLCRCDCGHERKLNPRSYILRGRSANCEKCLIVKRKQTVESFFWKSIKNNAERRKINFSVSQQFIFGLLQEQGFLCALTGLELFLAATVRDHTQGATTASLDRIDSSKGYTETNVQWLHKDVNKMKMDIPESRFIELCRAIAGYADRRILRESVDNNPAPCA